MAARLRVPLERSLVEQGHIPQAFLLEHLAQHWGVGYVELRVGDVKPEALRTVGEDYARANMLIPFSRVDGTVHVAMWDPGNRKVLGELGQMTGLRVVPCLGPGGGDSPRAPSVQRRPARDAGAFGGGADVGDHARRPLRG